MSYLKTAPVLLALAAALVPAVGFAYVGPGAGLSLLGALWGLLVAIGAALLFVVLWPLRRIARARREKKAGKAQPEPNPEQKRDRPTPPPPD